MKRLRQKWAIPAYVVGLWSLFGSWSRIEFIIRKTNVFLALSYARLVIFVASVAWIAWLVVRPNNQSEEYLRRLKELLGEAAAEFRATTRDPADLDATVDASFKHMKLLFFLDHAFNYKIQKDYSEWLKNEHEKWKFAGNSFPVDTLTADYLDALVRKIKIDDVDFGFYLPEKYEQYRRADDWVPNRRPTPTPNRL